MTAAFCCRHRTSIQQCISVEQRNLRAAVSRLSCEQKSIMTNNNCSEDVEWMQHPTRQLRISESCKRWIYAKKMTHRYESRMGKLEANLTWKASVPLTTVHCTPIAVASLAKSEHESVKLSCKVSVFPWRDLHARCSTLHWFRYWDAYKHRL